MWFLPRILTGDWSDSGPSGTRVMSQREQQSSTQPTQVSEPHRSVVHEQRQRVDDDALVDD